MNTSILVRVVQNITTVVLLIQLLLAKTQPEVLKYAVGGVLLCVFMILTDGVFSILCEKICAALSGVILIFFAMTETNTFFRFVYAILLITYAILLYKLGGKYEN